jgi:DNA polymerase I-like protein with 3'-5' exonuclease and polymerase domains
MAGDSTMLEAYRQGADLHRLTAAAIAGVPETAVTPAMRQLAKACNFGLIYGMSAATLAIYAASGYGVVMTLKEAEQAKRAFFTLYPGLSRWQSQTKVRGLRDSTVKTVGGLIRDFSAEPGGWQLTKALNSPVQGTGAEILLSALAALPQHLSGLEARLILHVHDEIVLEVIDKDVEHAKAALVSAMEAGWTAIFPEHPMAGLVEAHSGDNWYAAKG